MSDIDEAVGCRDEGSKSEGGLVAQRDFVRNPETVNGSGYYGR